MKKLILILSLFTAIGFAQIKGVLTGKGAIWTDSLGYGTEAVSDSVWIVPLDFAYEWYRVFLEGNSNATADSIGIQAGTIRYNEYGVIVDTLWGSYSTLKDSTWGNVNVMINVSTGVDYTLYNPVVQLLKFSLLNDRAALPTRNVTLTLQAQKPR